MSGSERDQPGCPSPPSEWDDLYSGTADDYEAPDPDLLEIATKLRPDRVLDDFEIARLEVVPTPVHEHAEDTAATESWTAALLEARRPGPMS